MARFRSRTYSAKLVFGGTEVTKTGATRFDLRDPYHLAVSLGWPAFFLATLAAHVVINLIFVALYLLAPGCLTGMPDGAFLKAYFFSLETLSTVSFGDVIPASLYGHVVVSAEILTGVVFSALLTGLIFARFARPKSKMMFADKAVIATHNGHPTLMIRIGNGRVTPLADARASLSAIQYHRTTEGHTYRGGTALKLERNHLQFFALTWTLMHRITPDSPIAGLSQENLSQRNTNLLLMIEARDQSLGAQVYGSRYYDTAEILCGMRYQDAVISDDHGRVHADLTRLSLIEPDLHNPVQKAEETASSG